MTRDLQIHTLIVYVPYPLLVFGREVFGEVIGKVFGSLLPVQAVLIFFMRQRIQWNRISKVFDRFRCMLAVRMP